MKKLLALSSLLLVLSLVLAGCGERLTAAQIVDRVRETAESTQDAHAVVKASLNAQGIEMSGTAEVWEKYPNKIRAEVLDASRPELKGTIVVSDGEQAWAYSPADNKVMVGSAGELELPVPQQVLSSMQDMVQKVMDASNAELMGEETVAGHETYKLVLTPKEGEQSELLPGNGTATLWVDKERWFVLKATYEAGSLGQGTMEVESLELNTGVSDDRFQFEVPEGAEVVDVEAARPQPLTLDEARAEAGFPLLVPTYTPAGATLIEVYKSGEAIILRYNHSPDVAFTVVQGKSLPDMPALALGRPTTIRGQDATAFTEESSGNTLLYWTENGVTLSVAGHIGLEEAIKVAESLQ